MQFKTLLFDIADSVATITLNRPEANHAIDLQMAKDLCYAAMHCSENSAVRAILITATGPVFCAGGDLKAMAGEVEKTPGLLKEMSSYLHLAISRLTRGAPPVVIAVNGIAMGAGMSLACAGDIAVAAQSATFAVAYTQVGLTPDGGLTYFLPRLVGLRRASELVLTNRRLSAKEALDLGLVTEVVPDAELMNRARTITGQLAAGATRAYGAARKLIHGGLSSTLETQMEFESQSIVDMARTADAHEAFTAFAEKRKPKFQGK
ncbi:MAG: enoyl-CoA hydratase-related protein [Dehalococcoidia bacterium]